MSLRDEFDSMLAARLADPISLPAEFWSYVLQNQVVNTPTPPQAPGQRLASTHQSNNVVTTGTTFATGNNLVPTLSFTASGSNSYVVRVSAASWRNSSTAANQLRLSLDGADAGFLAANDLTANINSPCGGAFFIVQPSAGPHSVNVIFTVSAGTGTIDAGAGGPNTRGPIFVSIEVA